MQDLPTQLLQLLREHHQEHLLQGWNSLSPKQRQELAGQLQGINFAEIAALHGRRNEATVLPEADQIQPVVMEPPTVDTATLQLGEKALLQGEVAVLLVAGGQGTRLGFDKPKGMFPIGPVSNRSLFGIHADKVFALSRRFGKPVPFLIMTSPATHAETVAYFEEQRFFGLAPSEVYFFQQGTMPAVDWETGQLLLERPGVLFASPNGHGGTLTALADSGLLAELRSRGIRNIFYFQVDNPLVRIADPGFLGRHLALNAEVSSKAIQKAYPKEKMGVLATIAGRCGIIEYSDMPESLLEAVDAHGQLLHRAGSPAIHFFNVDFLGRVTQGATRLPYHLARKKVPYLDANGVTVNPTQANALKFEMFVFDALPMAERWLVMESPRWEEFSPVKNADGLDSPATARQAITDLAGNWLESAGISVPRDTAGHVSVPLEISPRFALERGELQARLAAGQIVTASTCWQ